MIGVAAAAGAGVAVGWLLWVLLREVFAAEVFARQNFRGVRVATAVGVVIPLTVVATEASRLGLARVGLGSPGTTVGRVATVVVVVGFGLLGLLDDLAGSDDRGFRGHLRALASGSLTTGGLKLFGGGLVAAVVAGMVAGPGLGSFALDAAVIALAANLGNLFDRAPGRTSKVAVVAFAALVVTTGAPGVLAGPAVAVGGAMALTVPDLRERIMLGDTGANAIGAVVGLSVVLALDTTPRLVVGAVLLGLNLLSEVVSFSRVIGALWPLRAFDRIGRKPA